MTSLRRMPMTVRLTRQSPDSRWSARTVRTTDAPELSLLLYAAFRGTVDDEGDTLEDARREIEKTFSGVYGRFLSDGSFVVEAGGALASACLVSWYEATDSPLVVFAMTRPESKRRGMARTLLQTSMNALLDAGHERLTLIVTRDNEPAIRLYSGLGFRCASE